MLRQGFFSEEISVKQLHLTVALCVALALGTGGCARKGQLVDPLPIDTASSPSQKTVTDPDIQRRSEALHYFLMGQLSYINEDYKGAINNFSRASDLTDIPAPLIHTKLAELHLKQGNLEVALAECEQAIREDPPLTYNKLLKAGILEALGRIDEAEPVYLSIIRSKPETLDAYVFLSALYSRRGDATKSLDILKQLVKKAPQESFSHYYLAQAYENQGDLLLAEQAFERAHKLDPANVNLALSRVRVYLKEKKREQARALCQAVIDQNPENQTARKVMGHLLLDENRLDDALAQLSALEGLERDATDTRFKIALIQIERHNLKEAERELTLVLASKPDHEQARYYLATVYSGTGRQREAIDELKKIEKDDALVLKARTYAAFLLRQEQEYGEAEKQIRVLFDRHLGDKTTFAYLILILRDQHKYEEAEDLLRDALDDDPKNESFLFNLGLILEDLKKHREAQEIMEQVLQINPKNSDALNYVAYGLAEAGADLDRAFRLITEALQSKPRDGYFLDTLGWVYYQQGKYADAVQVLADAVQVVGNDGVVLEHYADALARSGDRLKAAEIYNQILEKGKFSDSKGRKKVHRRVKDKLESLRES